MQNKYKNLNKNNASAEWSMDFNNVFSYATIILEINYEIIKVAFKLIRKSREEKLDRVTNLKNFYLRNLPKFFFFLKSYFIFFFYSYRRSWKLVGAHATASLFWSYEKFEACMR